MPRSAAYTTRRYTTDDYEFLWHLHCVTEKDAIEAIWGWDETWQLEHWPGYVAAADWRIIQIDAVDVGAIATNRRDSGIGLHFVGLLPEYQKRGIGTNLIQEVLRDASADGLPVKLNVLKVNAVAHSLYRRLGFTEVDQLDGRHVMEASPAMPSDG